MGEFYACCCNVAKTQVTLRAACIEFDEYGNQTKSSS